MTASLQTSLGLGISSCLVGAGKFVALAYSFLEQLEAADGS